MFSIMAMNTFFKNCTFKIRVIAFSRKHSTVVKTNILKILLFVFVVIRTVLLSYPKLNLNVSQNATTILS